jgi:lipopolysaccharide/colanic/teichoic acid biosynthesis glycosyltransferase
MCVLFAVGYLDRQYISRLLLSYYGALLLVGFLGVRYAACVILRARYKAGDVWRVVILGTGRVARELATKIERHPEMLCRVIGLLFPRDMAQEDLDSVRPPIGNFVQVSMLGIMELLQSNKVNEVIVALPYPALPEVRKLSARCQETGIHISLVPQPYELYLSKPKLLDLDGLPVLQFREAGAQLLFPKLKRLLDVTVGAALGLVAAPIVLSCAFVLRIKTGRAFRWETRCGQNGTPFSILRLNVDRHSHSSGFESVLANLSVSELPQLWNVIRGEMSLVGPRPESQIRVRRYSEWQRQRLSVKPGMTGLAQVHGLREQNSSEEKTRFDLQYLMNPSLLSDVSLLLQTVWTLAIRVVNYSQLIPSQADNPATSIKSAEAPLVEALSAHSTESSAD